MTGKTERPAAVRRAPGNGGGTRGTPRTRTPEPATLRTTDAGRDTAAGEDRFRLVAEAAYFRAERRGFTPGQELDDWLLAEIEVDEMLGQQEPRV